MKDRWSRLGWALALAIPLAVLAVRWWTKPRPSPAPPEVLDWLKTNAIPLKTVEPGNGA